MQPQQTLYFWSGFSIQYIVVKGNITIAISWSMISQSVYNRTLIGSFIISFLVRNVSGLFHDAKNKI